MMRALALLALLLLAACAAPRAAENPAPPANVTAATAPPAVVDEEPVDGRIPDGIVPLTKEQEDAVGRVN